MEDLPPLPLPPQRQRQRSHNKKTRVVVAKPILSFQHDNKNMMGCHCITLLSDGTLLTGSDRDVRRWSLTFTEPSGVDTQQQEQQQESNTSSNNKEGETTKATNAGVKCLRVYKMKHLPFQLVELDPGESFLCDTMQIVYLIRVEDGTCLAKFAHSYGNHSKYRLLFLLGGTSSKDESVSAIPQQQQQKHKNNQQRVVASLGFPSHELHIWSISNKKTLIARHNDVIGVLESSGLIVKRRRIGDESNSNSVSDRLTRQNGSSVESFWRDLVSLQTPSLLRVCDSRAVKRIFSSWSIT